MKKLLLVSTFIIFLSCIACESGKQQQPEIQLPVAFDSYRIDLPMEKDIEMADIQAIAATAGQCSRMAVFSQPIQSADFILTATMSDETGIAWHDGSNWRQQLLSPRNKDGFSLFTNQLVLPTATGQIERLFLFVNEPAADFYSDKQPVVPYLTLISLDSDRNNLKFHASGEEIYYAAGFSAQANEQKLTINLPDTNSSLTDLKLKIVRNDTEFAIAMFSDSDNRLLSSQDILDSAPVGRFFDINGNISELRLFPGHAMELPLYDPLIGEKISKIEFDYRWRQLIDNGYQIAIEKIATTYNVDNDSFFTPLSADIATIIFNPQKSNQDYRLYRWNLDPRVIIYDTKNYAIQSRLFRRLAYFVEKPGFVGRLLSDSELEGKFDWNAHDYRAADLAEFFQLADEQNVVLNHWELQLKELLLQQGIIKIAEDQLEAGSGVVLSVSQESHTPWRYRFLSHEILHAIYFLNDQYRAECAQIWQSLNDEQQYYWRQLLSYRGYDVDNSYLLINEVAAYLLQQPIDEVEDYFKTFMTPRLLASRPHLSSFIERLNNDNSEMFISTALSYQRLLYQHYGRLMGFLQTLLPLSISAGFFNLFPVSY